MSCLAVCGSPQVPVLICASCMFTYIYIYIYMFMYNICYVFPVLFKICYELNSIKFINTVITICCHEYIMYFLHSKSVNTFLKYARDVQ